MVVAFNEPKYEIEAPDFQCHACRSEIPCESLYYSAVFFEQESFRRKNYCTSCWKSNFPSLAPSEPGSRASTARRSGSRAGGERASGRPGMEHQAPVPREAAPPHAPLLRGPEAEVFAFWRTRRPPLPSAEQRRLRFDAEVVFEFFRRLGADGDGQRVPAGSADAAPAVGAKPALASAERDQLRFVLALLLLRKKLLSFVSSRNRSGTEWLKMAERKDPRRSYLVRNPELTDSQLERIKDRIGELLQMQL